MTPPNWFGPFRTLPLSLSGFKGLLLHPTHTNTLPANQGEPPASQKMCVPPKLCLSFWHPQTLPVAPMGVPSWVFTEMFGGRTHWIMAMVAEGIPVDSLRHPEGS